ncbi:MAG: hypothetical protein IH617_03870 [Hydrogenophaga sp.]|nr:hypothetical protein [Hydrogenophaga sp.]
MSEKEVHSARGSATDMQWLPKLNLLLTMVLAVMGLWLNYSSQQQRQSLESIQAEVAASKDEREERASREQLRFQLFDKVTLSLREGNAEHVAATRTLVESLLSTMDPAEVELRIGLLRSLALRAPEQQRDAMNQALSQEEAFRLYHEELREKAVLWSKEAEGNLDNLSAYRMDMFYCSGGAASPFKAKAEGFARQMEGQVKAVKVRELAPSINASPGYGVIQTEIRFEDASEAAVAQQLQQLLSAEPAKPVPLRQVRTHTPLYLSVFVCG